MTRHPRLVFTCGDPNGIGLETFLGMLGDEDFHRWQHDRMVDLALVAPEETLRQTAVALDYPLDRVDEKQGEYRRMSSGGSVFRLIDIPAEFTVEFGSESEDAGRLAYRSIKRAVQEVHDDEFSALVTLPISKRALQLGGHDFPGHTELLAELTDSGPPLMILISEQMRVALVTIHEPLAKVPHMITCERLIQSLRLFNRSLLEDFGISRPRIAVLGLNPHSGEGGVLGSEEGEIIGPAVREITNEVPGASGPFPADAFFARYDPDEWDGVLAMYHDQGLIPLKYSAGGNGVNVTAGIDIVRTSPDHGTAFNIAGTRKADYRSLKAASAAAIDILACRTKR